MNYLKITIEGIIVGILITILGTVLSYIYAKMFKRKTKFLKNKSMYFVLFLTGFMLHVGLDLVGLNKWYCEYSRNGFRVGSQSNSSRSRRRTGAAAARAVAREEPCGSAWRWCVASPAQIKTAALVSEACSSVGEQEESGNFNRCSRINECEQPTEEDFPKAYKYYEDNGYTNCINQNSDDKICALGNRKGICNGGTCYERGSDCKKAKGQLCMINDKPFCAQNDDDTTGLRCNQY